MASSIPHIPAVVPITPSSLSSSTCRPSVACSPFMFGAQGKPSAVGLEVSRGSSRKRSSTVVSAVGDVSGDGTVYLIAGALGVALVGTAFPIFFSRKDTCPECDGAGFVRKSGVTLRANAARKDQTQIVCARCDGLEISNSLSCTNQVLSVAVYNHYKRIYHASMKKGSNYLCRSNYPFT